MEGLTKSAQDLLLERKAKKKAYYQKNKEKIIESSKKWGKDNLEKRRASSRKYYYNNRTKALERNLERNINISISLQNSSLEKEKKWNSENIKKINNSKDEHFIKGYDYRYTINKDGEVVSYYEWGGKSVETRRKIYKKNIVSKYFNTERCLFKVVNLRSNVLDSKSKQNFISTLMIEYFKLITPDDNHFYDLIHLDGDNNNDSLINLGWKLRLIKKFKKNFNPIVFHDNNRNVIYKLCDTCGEIKLPDEFILQVIARTNIQKRYKNSCKKCVHQKRWTAIKNDPEMMKKVKISNKRFSSSDKSKAYQLKKGQLYRDKLSNSYIGQIISRRGENPDVYTPEMRDIVRQQILIKRHIRDN